MAAQHGGEAATFSPAVALAMGIGIQNFPEGAAISLPLRQEGLSARKSFLYGSMSGIVEPIFGILVVLAAGNIQPLMPCLLSFAAGAMMYVVVEELIPEAHLGEHSKTGTLGVMAGFVIMMILDVALGKNPKGVRKRKQDVGGVHFLCKSGIDRRKSSTNERVVVRGFFSF